MASPDAEFVGPLTQTQSSLEKVLNPDADKAKRATTCKPIMDIVMSRENDKGSCIDAVQDTIVLGLAETRLGMLLMEEGDMVANGQASQSKASERRVAEAMVATQRVAIDNKSIRDGVYRIAASQFEDKLFRTSWETAYNKQVRLDKVAFAKLDENAKRQLLAKEADEFERYQREAKSQFLLSLREYLIRGEYK